MSIFNITTGGRLVAVSNSTQLHIVALNLLGAVQQAVNNTDVLSPYKVVVANVLAVAYLHIQ